MTPDGKSETAIDLTRVFGSSRMARTLSYGIIIGIPMLIIGPLIDTHFYHHDLATSLHSWLMFESGALIGFWRGAA